MTVLETAPTGRGPRRKAVRGGAARAWTAVGVLVALIVLWEAATVLGGQRFFPPPSRIVGNLPSVLFPSGVAAADTPFFSDVTASLGRMLAGFALGSIVGVLVGSALGWFRAVRDYVAPIVEFLRSIPATAVLPIFIMLLGLGPGMQVLFIAWGVSWFVLINTAAAVAELHPTMIDFCRTFRLSRSKVFFGVVLPSAAPKIFAGMRIGLTAAMILIVTSEFMGATDGIGFQLIQTQSRFQILDMWSWMVVIAVAGFAANTLLELIEARVLRWYTASKRK